MEKYVYEIDTEWGEQDNGESIGYVKSGIWTSCLNCPVKDYEDTCTLGYTTRHCRVKDPDYWIAISNDCKLRSIACDDMTIIPKHVMLLRPDDIVEKGAVS